MEGSHKKFTPHQTGPPNSARCRFFVAAEQSAELLGRAVDSSNGQLLWLGMVAHFNPIGLRQNRPTSNQGVCLMWGGLEGFFLADRVRRHVPPMADQNHQPIHSERVLRSAR